MFQSNFESPVENGRPEIEYQTASVASSRESVANVVIEEYNEEPVPAFDYVKEIVASPGSKVASYVKSLFPILGWIGHYPFTPSWIYSDFVAGVTVAIVLVPQSMSYAQLAGLSSEYGLYSSFVGVLIYAFFATSKDVSIGPVAVMSLEVGRLIARVQDKTNNAYEAPVIATMVALLCGSIALGLGLLRLGFIVELISLPAVLAFMTGSAFNIIVGQVPGLMGFGSHVNSKTATYKVVINTLKNLHRTKVDAAFGFVSLFVLYVWKYTTSYLYKRYPKQKIYFYLQQLRSAIVIIFSTLISYLVIRHHKTKHSFSVNGNVPSGLKHVGVMETPSGLVGHIASELPAATIILVLEHISISKSFGRVNDYKINPNQELIAIGVTNLIGTFFNAYPATGSFSRTALKAKCGVKTPFAGIFTGACVLLSIYCFTDAFYYIPKASLSAIIIHAVGDLLASYKITWNLWKIQPLDFAIFLIGVIITVFATIEDGIYFVVCASVAAVLWRLCKPNGTFLGRVRVVEVVDPILASADTQLENDSNKKGDTNVESRPVYRTHYRWVPLKSSPNSATPVHCVYVNDKVAVSAPPPGVIVFRPSETFMYSNCSRQVDAVLDEVKRVTRPKHAKVEKTFNNPGQLNIKWLHKITRYQEPEEDNRPFLKVVHFDFSQVTFVDATAVQSLIDLKKSLDLHAGHEYEIHFSGIISPWIRRALIGGGFGRSVHDESDQELKNADSSVEELEEDKPKYSDLERHTLHAGLGVDSSHLYALSGTNYPCFHFDIPSYTYLDE
ncbi:hypothetical protein KL905_002814 [Ogataea polymorpha]|uniref:uncharacterized protein n=1 Tax=Ogataea polymorpha TaxID=460523 RepID=UPI0007F33170|nr:uncharacterized protein OGAPODRAFT_15343 [Ogataea polymorpha]KAG7905015.1 hypothetical protein KL907_003231 [Ogataea polymorpha]KAG7921356.1 hypothetical protein KL905_002814 [Ogataea polymorpha]KAG7926141.1 hypothetical protein KL925_003903 [Ogataea polymorpha]KAG7934081.1 hypothetical protein KL934_003003 [Ogataea polymorpha]OBA18683.1 hypothetical protein OGAPODRAFT_15343 [Ogataea polymorpha]